MDHDFDLRGFSNVSRLFPLPGVVLLPHAVMPLHIFEPRYRQMTEDALVSDRLVTIVQVRPIPHGTSVTEPVPIEDVGCLGRIIRHERLPDGRFNFLLLGLKRVRLKRETLTEKLYRVAEVEILTDRDSGDPVEPRRTELIALFLQAIESQGPLGPDLVEILNSDIPLGILTDIVAQTLELTPDLRQRLLAEIVVDRRAEILLSILRESADQRPRRPFPPSFSAN